jgi:hypothetical protein
MRLNRREARKTILRNFRLAEDLIALEHNGVYMHLHNNDDFLGLAYTLGGIL